MRIFNRQLPLKDLYSRSLSTLTTVTGVVRSFQNPLHIIRHYFNGTTPAEKFIEHKDGLKILFSSHRHDLITALVIFARKDYGNIKKGSIVVDIGANIGIFSLFAAHSGAKRIYAIEPNSESFAILNDNIISNGLQSVVKPIKSAVSDNHGEKVLIPVKSSPYNAVKETILNEEDPTKSYETVSTTTLETIISENDIETIDLLKIDCEGHEFRIVPSLSPSILNKIREIKMEYQDGDVEILIRHLKANSFRITKLEKDERFNAGIIWLSK
jgi:FkbM family methyltransferase